MRLRGDIFLNKKDEIMNIVFTLFAKKGYEASMSEIARLAKIKVPSIYSHFASKDELVMLVIEKEINAYFTYMTMLIIETKEKEFKKNLEKFYYSTIDYFKTDNRGRFWRNIFLISNVEMRDKCRGMILENDYQNGKLFSPFFQQAVENKEIKADNLEGEKCLFFALIRGVLDLNFLLEGTNVDIDKFANQAWQAYWQGLKS